MDFSKKAGIVKSSVLFKTLAEEEIRAIAETADQKKFPTKTVIIEQCEKPQAAYLISKGLVRVYRMAESGNEVNLAILGPGEVVGEMSLLDECDRSASVETLQETEVLTLTKSDFDKVLAQNPQIARKMLGIFCRRLRVANECVEELAVKELKDRLFRTLMILSGYFPKGEINLSQEDLSAIVGATRPRVTEALGELEKQGKDSLSRRKIHLS